MKKITYELIDLMGSGVPEDAALMEIAKKTEDNEEVPAGAWYFALSPDRIDILDSLPWAPSMKVLQLGAQYGVFTRIAERTACWDIVDAAPEELELVRRRFPESLPEHGGNVRLLQVLPQDEAYDVVILFLPDNNTALMETARQLDPEAAADDGGKMGCLKVLARKAKELLRPGGSLLLIADNAGALKFAEGEKPDPEEWMLDADEAEELLRSLSLERQKTYYPLPNAMFAKNIF